MTKLLITYDTVDAGGVRGEACCEVEVSNAVANVLLTLEHIDSRQRRMPLTLEYMLMDRELLRDRRYVWDSIKDIRTMDERK